MEIAAKRSTAFTSSLLIFFLLIGPGKWCRVALSVPVCEDSLSSMSTKTTSSKMLKWIIELRRTAALRDSSLYVCHCEQLLSHYIQSFGPRLISAALN